MNDTRINDGTIYLFILNLDSLNRNAIFKEKNRSRIAVPISDECYEQSRTGLSSERSI